VTRRQHNRALKGILAHTKEELAGGEENCITKITSVKSVSNSFMTIKVYDGWNM
jgi:hypothetical protein